ETSATTNVPVFVSTAGRPCVSKSHWRTPPAASRKVTDAGTDGDSRDRDGGFAGAAETCGGVERQPRAKESTTPARSARVMHDQRRGTAEPFRGWGGLLCESPDRRLLRPVHKFRVGHDRMRRDERTHEVLRSAETPV